MVRKAALALAISAAALPTPSFAQFATGQDLVDWCTGEDRFKLGMCLGMIYGVSKGANSEAHAQGVPDLICIPQETVMEDIVDTVVDDLRQKQWAGILTGAFLVHEILRHRYPCAGE